MTTSTLPAESAAQNRSAYLYGCGLVLLAGLVLSLGVFAIRGASSSDALQYLLWRAVGFGTAMTVAAWLRDHRSPLRQISGLSRFGWLAAVAMTVSQMTFVSAVKIASFAEVFFLCSLAPLIAAALAGPLLGERMGWLGAAAIAMGLAGVWAMTGGAGLSASSLGLSGVLSLVSALAFALYSLATRGSVAGDRDATLIVTGIASFFVAVAILQFRSVALWPGALDAAIAMLHGALILAAGLFLFGQGSRFIPGVTFAMLAQFEAVVAPVWGFLFFAETPSLGVIAGGALILTAVVLQALDGARQDGGQGCRRGGVRRNSEAYCAVACTSVTTLCRERAQYGRGSAPYCTLHALGAPMTAPHIFQPRLHRAPARAHSPRAAAGVSDLRHARVRINATRCCIRPRTGRSTPTLSGSSAPAAFLIRPNTSSSSPTSSATVSRRRRAPLPMPHNNGRSPVFTHWDNVHAQKRLIEEVFGIDKLALIYGWSMGGQQALHWGAIFPEQGRDASPRCARRHARRHITRCSSKASARR